MTYVYNWLLYENFHPFWFRNDPKNQNKYFGDTHAKIWIKYIKTEPPEWMRYDSSIQDDYGHTIAMY